MRASLRRDRRGAAAVEMALMAPLLVTVVLGILGLGTQTVGRTRMDRAAASAAIAFSLVALTNGAEAASTALPASANGVPLCSALLDDTGEEIARLPGCGDPPISAAPLALSPGEAELVVWAQAPVGISPFRWPVLATWRVPLPR